MAMLFSLIFNQFFFLLNFDWIFTCSNQLFYLFIVLNIILSINHVDFIEFNYFLRLNYYFNLTKLYIYSTIGSD
jgi:hypothetical protein